MPWPRHVMQSVEIPVVTQTRISDDYTPSNEQWIIGDTIIVAHALGLAAFKDVSYMNSDRSPYQKEIAYIIRLRYSNKC